MTPALTLTTSRRQDGAFMLAVAGEIDMSNADAFSTALAGAREQATDSTLIVDLTRVEYLDSAGLAALFPHVEHLHLVATPLLAPVLTIVGLDDITTVQDG